MMRVLLLSILLFARAYSQAGGEKLSTDPTCLAIHGRSLDELLKNTPNIVDSQKLLECLPRKLIRQFTDKNSPHVEIVITCLENQFDAKCEAGGKGYKIIADSLVENFRRNNRCLNCNTNHPNIDFTISLLQRRHPKLLQRGLQFLTLQN